MTEIQKNIFHNGLIRETLISEDPAKMLIGATTKTIKVKHHLNAIERKESLESVFVCVCARVCVGVVHFSIQLRRKNKKYIYSRTVHTVYISK